MMIPLEFFFPSPDDDDDVIVVSDLIISWTNQIAVLMTWLACSATMSKMITQKWPGNETDPNQDLNRTSMIWTVYHFLTVTQEAMTTNEDEWWFWVWLLCAPFVIWANGAQMMHDMWQKDFIIENLEPPKTPPPEILYVWAFACILKGKEAPNIKSLQIMGLLGGVSGNVLRVFWFRGPDLGAACSWKKSWTDSWTRASPPLN